MSAARGCGILTEAGVYTPQMVSVRRETLKMVSIQMKSKTNEDGLLDLSVETGIPECEVDVTVLVQRAPTRGEADWPGFVRQVFGSIDDPTFERAPQGEYEHREMLA